MRLTTTTLSCGGLLKQLRKQAGMTQRDLVVALAEHIFVLLIQGEADCRCPPEQSEQFYAVLKANDCVVEMLRLPGSSQGESIFGNPPNRRVQKGAAGVDEPLCVGIELDYRPN